MRKLFFLVVVIISFSACKTGFFEEDFPNEAPETYTVIDTIIRFGEDRLNSQVNISWWGDDADGYVEGYEYSFDEVISTATNWQFVKSQDSVFVLSTPPGTDTLDFHFSVRSVDNEGAVDLTPASVYYPIKNTPPTIVFTDGLINPECSYPVFKVNWNANDADGLENLSHYELFLNDTTQQALEIATNTNAITFEAINPLNETSDARIYINNAIAAESTTISQILMNDTNRVYIRAVDKSDSRSPIATSKSIFIKQQTSNILMINAYGNFGDNVEEFYIDMFNQVGITEYDYLKILATNNMGEFTQQAPDVLTQSRIFNLFDGIVWFGNNASASLSLAQRSTVDFFNNNGKMLMSVYVSSDFDEQSNFLDFTPIQSLVTPIDTTLFLTDTAALQSLDANYPELLSEAFVGVVKPFELVPGAETIYTAEIIARDNATNTNSLWQSNSSVIARKKDGNGNSNFVLSTLEIHKLNDAMNMPEFFEQVLINEFGL